LLAENIAHKSGQDKSKTGGAIAKVRKSLSTDPDVLKDKKKITDKSKELYDPGDLINSPLTYAVVSAHDDLWAEKFDYSRAYGLFGNTDIAIKAIGPGNFTIKGVSFNPADVAQAASKVTTQAVLLAAQIAGVPVNIAGTPSGDGAALAKSSTRLSEAISELNEEKADMMGFKDALLIIAQTIVDEKDRLANNSGEIRKEAIDAIKAVYQSQKTRLSLDDGEE
jgi:hypothetical protein